MVKIASRIVSYHNSITKMAACLYELNNQNPTSIVINVGTLLYSKCG